MRKAVVLVVSLVVLFASLTCYAQAVQYQVVDLGTCGGTQSYATAINNHGQIIGNATVSDFPASFLWENGNSALLTVTGGHWLSANDINDSGQIVGDGLITGGGERGFEWDNGQVTELSTLGGNYSIACGINDSGRIVGSATPSDGIYPQGVAWDSDQTTELGTLTAACSEGKAVNDAGDVVGWWGWMDGEALAFVWHDGTMNNLGTLDGYTYSTARDINNLGLIVGTANAVTYQRAVAWVDGTIQMLDTCGDGYHSFAAGVNDSGQIVGRCSVDGRNHATLWQDFTPFDLNNLIPAGSGWELSQATAINDLGQIVGYGYLDGQKRAFLLNPVPEPSSLAALLCGLGGIGGIVWRRRG